MRILTEEELTLMFSKLKKYLGSNIKMILDLQEGEGAMVFRVIRQKVYLIPAQVVKQCSVFGKKELLHAGVCFGQFSKSGKFRIQVTCTDFLSRFSSRKIWLKSNGEQNFLYGNHVLKAHIASISEQCLRNEGVIIVSQDNIPLGFGVLAKTAEELKTADPTAIYVYN